MPNYNKLILIGHVTRDPEVRRTKDDKAFVKTGLAVNHKWGQKEEVMFIDVTFFGPRGEAFAKFHKKGSAVLVEGRLAQESWEKDGKKFSKHAMIASEWAFVASGKQDEEPSPRDENVDKAGTALDYGSDAPF